MYNISFKAKQDDKHLICFKTQKFKEKWGKLPMLQTLISKILIKFGTYSTSGSES